MTKFELLQDLKEARLIRNDTYFEKYKLQEILEATFVHLLTLDIMHTDEDHRKFVQDYAKKTMRLGSNFDRFSTATTDVHAFLYLILNKEGQKKLKDAKKDKKLRKNLDPDRQAITHFINMMKYDREVPRGQVNRFFLALESHLLVKDSGLRSLRRLARDWDDEKSEDVKLRVINKLLAIYRSTMRFSELYPELQKFANKFKKREVKETVNRSIVKSRLLEAKSIEKVAAAFAELGALQRDRPEFAMLDIQKLLPGGVLPYCVEHVGDISHRMSHMFKYGWTPANGGMEMVKPKVDRCLKTLNNPYGFEREHNENIQSWGKYYEKDIEEYKKEIDQALAKYAAEHSKLPAYNKAQHHAIQAAVELGNQNWNLAAHHLSELQDMCQSGDEYTKQVMDYRVDNDGNPILYRNWPSQITESVEQYEDYGFEPFDVDREDMPQIPKDQEDAFLDYLDQEGIAFDNESVDPRSLKPTQTEFNTDKLKKPKKDKTPRPIIISQDNYVLDGHHRWTSAWKNGEEEIRATRVYQNIKELFKTVHNFDGSETKDITESIGFTISDEHKKEIREAWWKADIGLKVGKTARFWRGVGDHSGSGMASYGTGLYIAGSRKEAMNYGNPIEMERSDLPQKPLRFRTINDYEIWLQRTQKVVGIDVREFNSLFYDVKDYIMEIYPEVDGIQISTGRDAIFVNWLGRRVTEIHEEVGKVWYHGSPDTRGLKKGIEDRTDTMTMYTDIEQFSKLQDEMHAVRLTDTKRYHELLDQAGKLKTRISIPKPMFFTDSATVAKTYTDEFRAMDYQNAEGGILRFKIDDNVKKLTIMAYGERFSALKPDVFYNALKKEGYTEDEIHTLVRTHSSESKPKGFRLSYAAKLAYTLGYKIVDFIGVIDAYNGGNPTMKSTVRVVFDMSLVKLISNEDGRIVKGVNTTIDVDVDAVSKEAAKFGFDVSKDGYPKLITESTDVKTADEIDDYVVSIHNNTEDFDEGDLRERIYGFSKYHLVNIDPNKIRRDQHYYDDEVVDEYVKLIHTNNEIPPIVMQELGNIIIDGTHRHEAAIRAGLKSIPAYIGLNKDAVPDSMNPYSLNESKIEGAAIKDHLTGKVYGPEYTHHDVRMYSNMYDEFRTPDDDEDSYLDRIWDMVEGGRMEDGFISDSGKFYSREEAAKAIKLDPMKGDSAAGHNPERNWLDAFDLDTVDNTIHEDYVLTELFDKTYQWDKPMIHTSGQTTYTFKDDQDNRVSVFLTPKSASSPNYELDFTRNGYFTRTGDGDEFRIMGTVIAIVAEFINKNENVVSVGFSAIPPAGASRDSRSDLYKRIIKRYADSYGLEYAWEDDYTGTEFIIRKKENEINEIREIPAMTSADDYNVSDTHKLDMIKSGQMKKVKDYGTFAIYAHVSNGALDQDGGLLVIADKDKKTMLSFLSLKPKGNKMVSAGMVWTHPKHRKNGYAAFMYDYVIKSGYKILSDIEQTQKSKELWKRLVGRYNAYLIDKSTNQKISKISTDKEFNTAYRSQKHNSDPYLIVLESKTTSSLREEDEDIVTVYHVTKEKNLKSIMKRGLIPQVGVNSEQIDDKKGIHVFTDWVTMEDAVGNWDNMDWDDDLIVLTIKVPASFVEPDDVFDNVGVITQRIPTTMIEDAEIV